MEIAIELLALVLPVVVGFILFSFFMLTKYIKIWRYKPENDKGKLGEDYRKSRLATLPTTAPTQRRSVFSLPASTGTGGDKRSTGTTSRSNAKTFNPFRRK